MIRSSLQNKFTKINFFFHNLGQMKGLTRDNDHLLSFMLVHVCRSVMFQCIFIDRCVTDRISLTSRKNICAFAAARSGTFKSDVTLIIARFACLPFFLLLTIHFLFGKFRSLILLFLVMQFYVYRIWVERNDASTYSIFRRFSEFAELNHKLSHASSIELPRFPSKIFVGRSHTRQVRITLGTHA